MSVVLQCGDPTNRWQKECGTSMLLRLLMVSSIFVFNKKNLILVIHAILSYYTVYSKKENPCDHYFHNPGQPHWRGIMIFVILSFIIRMKPDIPLSNVDVRVRISNLTSKDTFIKAIERLVNLNAISSEWRVLSTWIKNKRCPHNICFQYEREFSTCRAK